MPFSDFGIFLGDVSLTEENYFTKDPMKAQNTVLKKILRRNKNCEYGKKYNFADIKSFREYQDKVPLTTYADYEPYVDRMLKNKENNLMFTGWNVRYCSSSGSLGKPKILPKSVKDLWTMQCIGFSASVATAAHWIKKHQNKRMPASIGPLALVLTGHRLEDGKQCNGAGQIPLTYLKAITPFFCTSPLELLYPEHEELLDTAYLQTFFAVKNEKVSYLGSMVITLLTTMFDCLEEKWEMICHDIETGTIDPSVKITPELRAKFTRKLKPDPKRAAFLRKEFEKGFDDPIAPRIWPNLTWAYGMINSTLSAYVDKLKRYIGPDVPIHNMGYAAAEGFFAMATELNVTDGVLLPNFILFEFLPINEGDEESDHNMRPLLINELEVGKTYELIVSNFSGLYRYRMEDVVKVTGMYNNTPRVEFLYRLGLSMNLANEKTTSQMVDWAAEETAKEMGDEFVGHSFSYDYSTNPPRYCMLAETTHDVSEEDRQKYIDILDEKLKGVNEKYFKYRRWGMINRPEILFLKEGTYNDYKEMLRQKGVVLNQIKPVTVINTDERREFFFSHVATPGEHNIVSKQ